MILILFLLQQSTEIYIGLTIQQTQRICIKFVQRRPTSSTLTQHCTKVIQMFVRTGHTFHLSEISRKIDHGQNNVTRLAFYFHHLDDNDSNNIIYPLCIFTVNGSVIK